jgi:hypothetical protein
VRAFADQPGCATVTGMLLLEENAPRSWDDIPAVGILGAVLGVLLLWVAIRALFGKRDDPPR